MAERNLEEVAIEAEKAASIAFCMQVVRAPVINTGAVHGGSLVRESTANSQLNYASKKLHYMIKLLLAGVCPEARYKSMRTKTA